MNHFRKGLLILTALAAGLAVIACGAPAQTAQPMQATPTAAVTTEEPMKTITPEEAKALMDSGAAYTLVDVRTQEEYDQGHIAGAKLIPDYELADRAATELPDKNAIILVYCRSGRRSAAAAKKLVEMGYTDIRDLGGIINWPYDVVTD